MADQKISELTSLTILAGSDLIPVVDVDQTETKNITKTNLMASPGPIGGTTPNTGEFTTLELTLGATVDEISTDGTFVAAAGDQLATALAIKTYVDASAGGGTHNDLDGLQGGDSTAQEFYHLTQSIHDGLFSASPIIGLGNESGTNLQVDYGGDIVTVDVGAQEVFRSTYELDGPDVILHTYLGEQGGGTYIHVEDDEEDPSFAVDTYVEGAQVLRLSDNVQTLGHGVETHINTVKNQAWIELYVDGNTASELEMKITTDGMALKTGPSVNSISNDPSLSSGFDSTSTLVTEEAIKGYVDASAGGGTHNDLSGLQGGDSPASEFYHLDLQTYSFISSDSTSLIIAGDIVCDDLFTSGSTINVGTGQIKSTAGNVELYHAGALRLETTATGIEIAEGTHLAEIMHDGTTLKIKNYDHGGFIKIYGEAANGTEQLLISANGATNSGGALWLNNKEILLWSVYGIALGIFTGSREFLMQYTGGGVDFTFDNNVQSGKMYFKADDSGDVSNDLMTLDPNGAVDLYYAGDKKFETDSTGVIVAGDITTDGVKFPATEVASSDPNTLSDYEEGTFTPEIADATTGGNTASPGTANGAYTKIGNKVTINVRVLNVNTTGLTGGNTLYIRNLPFPPNVTNRGYVATPYLDQVTWGGDYAVAYCNSADAIHLRGITSGGAPGAVPVSGFADDTADVIFVMEYFV